MVPFIQFLHFIFCPSLVSSELVVCHIRVSWHILDWVEVEITIGLSDHPSKSVRRARVSKYAQC